MTVKSGSSVTDEGLDCHNLFAVPVQHVRENRFVDHRRAKNPQQRNQCGGEIAHCAHDGLDG